VYFKLILGKRKVQKKYVIPADRLRKVIGDKVFWADEDKHGFQVFVFLLRFSV